MSLISVRVFYYYCPETTKNLAIFPRTISGDDSASLVEVHGACVTNALVLTATKNYCGGNGEWKIATGSCECAEGSQPNSRHTACYGTYYL